MNEPGYITNFIKLDELTDKNRKHLTNIGVSLDWLDGLRKQNFNPPVESDLWEGFPPSSGRPTGSVDIGTARNMVAVSSENSRTNRTRCPDVVPI